MDPSDIVAHPGCLTTVAIAAVLIIIAPFVLLEIGILAPVGAIAIAVPATLGLLGVLRFAARQSRRTPFSNGQERFLDQTATVTEMLTPAGRVKYHGENWAATLEDAFANRHIPVGGLVRVVRVDGLRLIVTPPTQELIAMVHEGRLTERAESQVEADA